MNIDMRNDLNKLFNSSYKFKTYLLKSIINLENFPKDNLYDYLRIINSLLDQYYNMSIQIKKDMIDIDPVENSKVLSYTQVKSYIYAHNDYSSILPYTDAIIKGINEHKFENKSDIDDFTKYMIEKTFPNMGFDTSDITDIVSNLQTNTSPATPEDIIKYNIVKEFDLFNFKDKYELKTSIENTLNFIVNGINNNDVGVNGSLPLFINSVIEYINFSIAVFVSRIYIMNLYVYGYQGEAITESYSEEMEQYIWVMKKTDEIIARDYTQYKHFVHRMLKFADQLGINIPEEDIEKIEYNDKKYNNELISKLNKNELYKLIRNNCFFETDDKLIEFVTELRYLYYSNKHSIKFATTVKDELFYLIKNVGEERITSNYIKEEVEEFIIFSIRLLFTINDRINTFLKKEKCNTFDPEMSITADSKNSEAFKILGELYRDTATLILYKLKDMEVKYNKAKNKNMNSLSSKLELDDYRSSDAMRSAMPEMIRNPEEFKNNFIRNEFEYLQLESYQTMIEYELENDPYYININESFSISDLINKLKAWILALKRKFDIFYNDAQLKAAIEWVKNNQSDLMNMKYNGTLSVLPYRKDIDVSFVNDFVTTLNTFDKNIIDDEAKRKEFVTKLYKVRGKDLSKLFLDEKYKNNVNELYTNFILFDADPTQTNQSIKNLEISNDQIKSYLKFWIETVTTSTDTHKAINDISQKIENAINGMKNKVVSSQSVSQNNTQNNDQKNEESKNDTKLDTLLISIYTASEQLFGGLYYPLTKAMKDQYTYIKEAYTIGRK